MIKRDRYVNSLINKKWNGRVKIITGIRRCGKSTILRNLFKEQLIQDGVSPDKIIEIALDENRFENLRDPNKLAEYIREQIKNTENQYYLFIDEIQFAISSEEIRNRDVPVRIYGVLNELINMGNIDVYVTGSNSKLLSKDVATEFRGRGDVIHVYPLSFSEFYSEFYKKLEVETPSNAFMLRLKERDAYDEYVMFGGMPQLFEYHSDQEKQEYLTNLFEEIYFKDIEERYQIKLPSILKEITNVLSSNIGSLTNASKIADTIVSTRKQKIDTETISTYIGYLIDSFLFAEARRYDVKGRKYFEYPLKYYCSDVGLRNAKLGFRQIEETHIMENIIYNELVIRGYYVDVGTVSIRETDSNKKVHQKNIEVDFVARKGNKQYYIQSALNMDDPEKEGTEIRPFIAIRDSFRKIVISKSYGKSWVDEKGILRIGIMEFLLNENSLDL